MPGLPRLPADSSVLYCTDEHRSLDNTAGAIGGPEGLLFSRRFLNAEKAASPPAGVCARVADKSIPVKNCHVGVKLIFLRDLYAGERPHPPCFHQSRCAV